MKDKSLPVIIVLSVFIFLFLAGFTITVGVFQFNWFGINQPNNFVRLVKEKKELFTRVDQSSDINTKSKLENKTEMIKDILKDGNKKFLNLKNVNKKDASSDIKFAYSKGKGSGLKDQEFHSLGEFVSDEEASYRKSLVKNLRIKTIRIDKITKGNGVSQEYYKVAYQYEMIPAKILEQLVESKEFRTLIPKKYLTKEFEVIGFKANEFVEFKNTDIKSLLKEWCLGRLSPVQKAWQVKAVR